MKKLWGALLVISILIFLFAIGGGGGGCSHSRYLHSFEVKVLGNSNFLAGSRGALRVITFDPSTDNPVKGVPVKIFLKKSQKKDQQADKNKKETKGEQTEKETVKDYGREVFSGKTGKTGTLNAAFDVPSDVEGAANLTIVAGISGKTTDVKTKIHIKKKFKIYLTTDKPMYQPGQVINIRALALNVPNLNPVAERDALIEVMDAKGNKVFKQKASTSKFGICFAKFQLADEVNMGAFRVKATLGKESAIKTVTVKRYVLPKFKIKFEKDRKFYQPGDTLKGDLQVDYFFGKPVAGGKVKVKLYTFDVEFKQAALVKGKTGKKGHYSFEIKLPKYLVGQPLEKGKAVTKLEIEVVDRAEHKEKAVRMIPVSGEALTVQMIPESGRLKRGLDNRVYILTSYPDGSPAKATVNLTFLNRTRIINTDAAGISSFIIKPEKSGRVSVKIEATDPKGGKVNTTKYLRVGRSKENIILRTSKAEYKVGRGMTLEVLSTTGNGVVYLDVVKNRQTVLTKAVKMDGNRSIFPLEVTPEMAGMISIHAYRITKKNQIIRDTRNLYIKAADDLKIAVKPDKSVYKPGEDAKITFTVTGKNGRPVAAALGVDIVDEAVFAMGEMMPGLEKVYFLLEKQLMEPKFEIHGITIKDAVLSDEQIVKDQQVIRKVLFSKIPSRQKFSININTYDEKMRKCYKQMNTINSAVYKYFQKHRKWPGPGELDLLIKEGFLKPDQAKDPWGHRYYLTKPAENRKNPGIMSAGPNGKIGDGDDLTFKELQKTAYRYMRGGRRRFDNIKGMPRPAMAQPPRVMLREKRSKMDMNAELESPQDAPDTGATGDAGGKKKTIRVREYFPETLYTNPQVITDEKGNAQIGLTMADSITTWRLTAFANSMKGLMGNTTAGVKVFQDFFIDIDFPVALTQGDQVSVPIAVYNYLKEEQTVKLKVEAQDWFKLNDRAEKSVKLKPDEVNVVYFRIKVKELGNHKLTVRAEGTRFSDAVRREIRIVPDGEEVNKTVSDKLKGQLTKTINVPKEAIPGASQIFVRIYPGVVSQVIEGLDKILRMPGGCFEQTTASTYPNVLVLEYLTRNKKITPAIRMKAEGYINTGYQRLVSFEVPGGGFSWFGRKPANRCLTALGILQFRDMSKVHSVDEQLISRTQQWLARQQNGDGSWSPDKNYLHANTWKKMQGGGKAPVTAYIVWALAESGYKGDDLKKGLAYLKKNSGQLNDPYVLALVCNAMTRMEPDSQATKAMLDKLAKMAKVTSDSAHWGTSLQTATYTKGNGANVETTALAALALLRVKGYEDLASKAVNYLIKGKDSFGTWHTTQTTILAMKALLLAQDKATEKINAKVKITVNDEHVQTFDVNSENYDVYRQADFSKITKNGANKVNISIQGEGSCYYQIASRYYMPWKLQKSKKKALSIDVKYDRSILKTDDMLTCSVKVKNNTGAAMKMVMIDLGVPPGFTVMAPDLNEYVGTKFEKYKLTSRQIIIYTDTVKPGQLIKFKYRLRAKYPLKAKTPKSKAYQYYNPEIKAVSEPVTLEVK